MHPGVVSVVEQTKNKGAIPSDSQVAWDGSQFRFRAGYRFYPHTVT